MKLMINMWLEVPGTYQGDNNGEPVVLSVRGGLAERTTESMTMTPQGMDFEEVDKNLSNSTYAGERQCMASGIGWVNCGHWDGCRVEGEIWQRSGGG